MDRPELASRAGMSRQAIWYIENGRRMPRPENWKKLADALGKEMSDIAEAAYADRS